MLSLKRTPGLSQPLLHSRVLCVGTSSWSPPLPSTCPESPPGYGQDGMDCSGWVVSASDLSFNLGLQDMERNGHGFKAAERSSYQA